MCVEKSCKNCIWYKDCCGTEICLDYYPVCEQEDDGVLTNMNELGNEEAYELDLFLRHVEYMKLVEEQNS